MYVGALPNLHITLHGNAARAGSYVPFGKTLVRKLIANGRFTDGQTITLADGTRVEVKVVGEQQWLRITAPEGGPFLMESGIIGLQNIGFSNASQNDGIMHYSPAIRAYSTGGILTGEINALPSVKSTVTPEKTATKAMRAGTDAKGNRTDESLLAYKKMCAVYAPPSIFTGKLRLYFQAHYGTKLKSWKFSINPANQPPSLDWESKTLPFHFHSVNTGIYTDSHKLHWLIQLGVRGAYASSDTAHVFKMKCSAEMEKLRPLLLDPSVSGDDKERIEAYILADSYPDPEFHVARSVSIPLNWSLGYGWHFNWSGTAADIVRISTVSTGGVSYKHKSTHYRISVTRNEDYVDTPGATEVANEERRWSFNLSTIEEAEWKNAKWQNVIASPDWGSYTLSIFGMLWGERFGNNAPVYVFYTRDELNVVRFSHSGGGSKLEYSSTSAPSWFMGEAARGVYPGTFPGGGYDQMGTHASSAEGRQYTTEDVNASFKCSTTEAEITSSTYSFISLARSEISYSYVGEYSCHINGYMDYEYSYGPCTPGAPLSRWGTLTSVSWENTLAATIPLGARVCEVMTKISYTTNTSQGYHHETGLLLFVVPFGDAEAAYLWARKDTVTTASTHSGSDEYQSLYDGPVRTISVDGTYLPQENYGGGSMGGGVGYPIGDAGEDTREETYDVVVAKVISNSGATEFDPSTEAVVSAFFAGEPVTNVAQTFDTRTSAGRYADIRSSGVPLTGGYAASLNHKSTVFSGWA